MSDLEALLDQELAEEAPPPPKKATKTVITSKELKKSPVPVVKGDFAKALAPSYGNTEDLESQLDYELEKDTRGYSVAKPLVIQDPDVIRTVQTGKKTLEDQLDEELKVEANPLQIGADQPKTGLSFFSDVAEKLKPKTVKDLETSHPAQKALRSEVGKKILTALSVDEHLIVKGLSKASGLPDKEDLSDYTYTTYLKDMGAPDSKMTDAMGLALSIYASPSTYLTAGQTGAIKAGTKSLSKRGVKLANEITKARVDARAAAYAAKSGKELSDQALSALARAEREKVYTEIATKFGSLEKGVKAVKVSDEVAALPKSVMDPGGLKLSTEGLLTSKLPVVGDRNLQIAAFQAGDIKFFGKTLISGQEVAKTLDDVGLPKITKALAESDVGQAIKRDITDPAKHAYAKTKDILGKAFIPNYGISREVVKMWDDTETTARGISRRINEYTENWFKGMNAKQRQDFAESAINASTKAQKIEVKSLSGDPAVQAKLDRWYGQGKYAGRTSIAQRMAKWSELVEDKQLANWFPGIDARRTMPSLKIGAGAGKSEREFLQSRGADPKLYTRDPVKAISYRATEIAFANLQDKFYERVVKSGLGEVRKFTSPQDALLAGYVPLRRPMTKLLAEGGDLTRRATDEVFYAKKEFVDQYNQLIKDQRVDIPVISYATRLFKQHVTSLFPSFHFRNANSNIALNAMHIGGHAIEPKKFKAAVDMVRGKNLDRVIVTDIGEKLSLKQILQEANDVGAIKGNQYFADIAGETLGGEAQTVWNFMFKKANPLSMEFTPAMWGKNIGEKIETQARLVNYMTWRQKGLSPKLAAIEANEALFDYGAVTKFEQNVAKLVIPFYTFSRKNLANHIKVYAHRPGALSAQLKFFRELGPTEDDWEGLPEWAKNKFVSSFRGNFTTGFGLPLEDILELMDSEGREILVRTNPVFRYGAEKVVGQDFFSGRPLQSVNSAKEFELALKVAESEAPAWVKKPFQDIVSFMKLERDPSNPLKIIGDPDKLHILRSSFTSRWQSMIGLIEDDERAGYEAALRFATGIAKLPDDLPLQTSIARRKGVEKVFEIGEKTNMAKRFGTFFVGGTPEARKRANWYLEQIQKGVHPSQIREYVKMFEEEATERQKARTEP
jgi:hypothetical protein